MRRSQNTTLASGQITLRRKAGLSWRMYKARMWLRRRAVSLVNRINLSEDAFIRRNFDGIPEKLDFSLGGSLQQGIILRQRGFEFKSFNIDSLPWNYDELDRNIDLTSLLIAEECPVKTIDVFYKPSHQEKTQVAIYVEQASRLARELGQHTDVWEQDLSAVSRHINATRIQHLRYGVYSPEQLTAKDFGKHLEGVRLSDEENAYLLYGILNGFGGESQLELLLKQERDAVRSLSSVITPISLNRFEGGLLSHDGYIEAQGRGTKSFLAAIDIFGLGVNKDRKDWFNTDRWLRALLPYEVRDPGDVVILVSTFYAPKEPLGGPRTLLETIERDVRAFSAKEEKEGRIAKEAEEKGQRLNVSLLTDAHRNYMEGIRLARKKFDQLKDRVVFASFKILIQSPDSTRTQRLVSSVMHRLEDGRVLAEPARKRAKQLRAIKSALPIIYKEDVTEKICPFPLRVITGSLVPDLKFPIPENQLKILVGKELPLGDPYYWPFLKSFCLLAGQQAGKTGLMRALIIRLDGMLQDNAVFWVYDGTEALEEDQNQLRDYGWPAIARHVNRSIKTQDLPEGIRSGVIYASNYRDPDILCQDVLKLRDAGARLIVFSTLESQHKAYQIEYGFFSAFKEHMRLGHPGVFFVDETLHLAKDRRANVIFEELAPGMTKRNQWFGWTGQTTAVLPEEPGNQVRSAARANTRVVCMGSTPLISTLAEEASINIDLFKEKARLLAEVVADFSIRGEPGVFVASEAGGKLMTSFKVVIEAETSLDMVRRKSKEEMERFGI